jgi:CRP-like cAMP-binding protein
MDDLIKAIQPNASTRFVKKGSILLYQSEIPRNAFIVRKGLVRAYTITSAGEERIVSLHTKGDIFPLSWIYGETTNTLFYYEASADTEVLCISKDELVRAVTTNPKLLQDVLKFTINEYTALLLRVTALEQSSAAEKIALTLYYLIIRHGLEKKPGEFTIDIKMTQSMIASLVGLTRESTAVNLKLLKKRKIITYSNFIYVVNKPNLERFVGEDSFKDLDLG